MGITVSSHFNFGQIVYLKTDVDQYPRIITAMQATADGGHLLRVSSDTESSWHYECELSEDIDIKLKTSY